MGFHLKLIMTFELVRPKGTPDREYCHGVLEFSYHIHPKVLISLLNRRIFASLNAHSHVAFPINDC